MTEYTILLAAALLALGFFRRAQRCERESSELARYREMRRALRESIANRSSK